MPQAWSSDDSASSAMKAAAFSSPSQCSTGISVNTTPRSSESSRIRLLGFRELSQRPSANDPATAETPTGQAATVWAWVTSLTITPGTSNATTYDQPRCQVAHLSANGHSFILGSRYTHAAMAKVGVNQPIDCGVTYTAPGTYRLTANVTWNACWTEGLATPGGPPATGCKPVPGATALAPTTTAPVQINVRDIQSVNNGA